MALFLITVLLSSPVMSANALKKYGYKKGDEYRFVLEMASTIKTDEGTTSSSQSYEVIYKIKDIDEDVDGYDIKIDLVVVGFRGFYPGFYGYGGLLDEITIEGDKLMPDEGSYGSWFFNLFTSTDWSDREDEWEDFIDKIDDQEGYKVKEDSASNGAFSLQVELDVDDDDTIAIDYDGDGDKDGYTGWWTFKGEYDETGVLKASSWESYMEFDRRNSVTSSLNIYRGGSSALVPREIFIYIALIAVSFSAAFVSGFFFGKHKVPKEAGAPAIDVSSKPLTKHCIHCGEEISLDAAFCTKCGKKQ